MALIDGLVSYYKLDEIVGTNADDAHGANDGTANNARVFTSEATGIINTCADFTAGSDGIITGLAPFSLSLPFSLSAWFKINSFSGNGLVVGLWSGLPPGNDREKINARIIDATQVINVSTVNSAGARILLVSDSFSSGVWIHLVYVCDGTTSKLYLNNDLKDTDSLTSLYPGERPFSMGYRAEANDRYINGYVDEVGIWSKALDTTEIAALYNNGNGLAYPFVVGTNMKINISDVFKDIESLKINIGDAWKNVIKVQQNIGDVWKDVFG